MRKKLTTVLATGLLMAGAVLVFREALAASRIVGQPCNSLKKCLATLTIPGVGVEPITFEGKGNAAVGPTTLGLQWSLIEMRGHSNLLNADLTATLDPATASLGTFAGPDYPTVNHNNLFLQIDGAPAGQLISGPTNALQLEGYVTSTPPKAVFTQVGGSVNYYVRGDGTQTTRATISNANVTVVPRLDMPSVSGWGMVALALGLLAASGILFFVRNRGISPA